MIMLGSRASGRDNNLNLIRAIAATAVLVSHSVPIAIGSIDEPLKAQTGHSLGGLSVFVFFAISGFLITASFQRSSSHLSFLLARGLRLWPGLIVNLVLVALVLGPLVTTLPVWTYLTLPDPYLFILRDMLLVPLQYLLPGVFRDNPVTGVVGPIWTLRHEVACYGLVFLAGLAGLWQTKLRAGVTLGVYVVVWMAIEILQPTIHPLIAALHPLSLPFALGTAFWIWRDRIILSLPLVLGLCVLPVLTHGTVLYLPALVIALCYASFWLGYVPGGILRSYNRLGDYSYGIYIWAFPIQGLMVWLFGAQTPLENILLSLPPTILLSVLSWHFVEKPAMQTKPALLAWLTRGKQTTRLAPGPGDTPQTGAGKND